MNMIEVNWFGNIFLYVYYEIKNVICWKWLFFVRIIFIVMIWLKYVYEYVCLWVCNNICVIFMEF